MWTLLWIYIHFISSINVCVSEYRFLNPTSIHFYNVWIRWINVGKCFNISLHHFFPFQMKTFIQIQRCTRNHYYSASAEPIEIFHFANTFQTFINRLHLSIDVDDSIFFQCKSNRIHRESTSSKLKKEKSLHSHPRTMNHGIDVNRYALDKFIIVSNKQKSFDKRCNSNKIFIIFFNEHLFWSICVQCSSISTLTLQLQLQLELWVLCFESSMHLFFNYSAAKIKIKFEFFFAMLFLESWKTLQKMWKKKCHWIS